jgi:hypothetical protein
MVGTTQIEILGNVWVRGAGMGITTLQLPAGSPFSTDIIEINTGSSIANVQVSDLTIDGNNNTGVSGSSIFAQGVTNLIIQRVEISRMYGMFGILGQGILDSYIMDNRCKLTTARSTQNECIILTQALPNNNVIVARNTLINSGMEADGTRLKILDNTITGWNFGAGIVMGPFVGTYDNIVTGNHVYSSGLGPDSSVTYPVCLEIWSYKTVIANNVVHDCAGSGISSGGDSNTIVGNVTYDNGRNAASTTGLSGIIIQYYANNLWSNGSNNIVSGNRSYNTNGVAGPQTYAVEINALITGLNLGINSFAVGSLGVVSNSSLATSTLSAPLVLNGSTSGSATIAAQAVAGTPSITLGTSSGTPAVAATAPLAITAATGNITCTGCLTNTPAALTKTDDTNVTLTLGGTPTTALLQATSLTLGWTGTLANARLATMATNTVKGNATAGTASPTDLAVSTCSTAASALIWTTNTGFGCNTSITAAAVPVGGITGLGTGIATALAVNVGTAGAPVINGGALGSPSSAGTLPAYTLGGTVSGGGNQINNVIIGTSTPLAGSFTALTASTSAIVTSASANALTAGLNGATHPAFNVDASTASQTAGLNVKGAALNGTVAVAVIDTSGNTNLTINALGSGTIGIGSVSTGGVTITPATTITGITTLSNSTAANGPNQGALQVTGGIWVGADSYFSGSNTLFAGTAYYQGNLGGTYPNTNSGVALGGNFSNGNSEIDFFNTTTVATDSFRFYQQTGASAATLVAEMLKTYFSVPLTTATTSTTTGSIVAGGGIAAGGAIAATLANAATTSAVCYNTGTGLFSYDGTLGTCTISDERLKNMGPRIPNALEKLLKINGVYYTWKDPAMGKGRQIGMGAQTVERVFPELVQTDSHGTKSLDYQRLTAPIIEAIRELKADNDNLRHEVEQLKWRVR